MSLMSAIVGLSGAVPRFSSFSSFLACIDLVAHNIVELQSEREWVENESVDKKDPQKTRHNLFVLRIVSAIKIREILEVVFGDAPWSRLG